MPGMVGTISVNVPSPLLLNSWSMWYGSLSCTLITYRSGLKSMGSSSPPKKASVGRYQSGMPGLTPLDAVTSVKVPSQSFL